MSKGTNLGDKKKISITAERQKQQDKTMNKTSKFAEVISVDLNRLVIPAAEGFSQEVRIFRGMWDEDTTVTQIKALGKEIISEALRNTLTNEVFEKGVRITTQSGGLGYYNVKLTQEAVDALLAATEDCRYDSVDSRLDYAIWYNRD